MQFQSHQASNPALSFECKRLYNYTSTDEEDVSTSECPYQPGPIISIDDERFGQYPHHHCKHVKKKFLLMNMQKEADKSWTH